MGKDRYHSNKNYKVSLILSAIVLLLLFLAIIFQILRLQSSGNVILTNLEESKDLNSVINRLDVIEEKLWANLLSVRVIDSIEKSNQNIITRFKNNYPSFQKFVPQQDSLYSELRAFGKEDSISNSRIKSIENLIADVKSLKQQLIAWHTGEIEINSSVFVAENSLFPKLFITASIIGIIILAISLFKIFNAQKTISEKSNILDSILENTNDIANFYKPVYEDGAIIDFKITYASKSNVSLTDVPYQDLIGTLVSETFPFLKTSGLFNQLVNAYKNQEYFEKALEFPIGHDKRYFKARYIPVKSGLQVIVTEFTSLFTKKKELEKSNKALTLNNQLFHEAEEVAQLGSYVWYLRDDVTDRSDMSDNVYRILGFEPQSFPMSASKFREFAHPDDLEAYDSALAAAYEKKEPVDFTFRIISRDDKVKYIYTKGDFGEREGKEIMVGIIQDVTKQVANENKLKSQNIELARRNVELDAFNRVASHDLQEPLRKIQMFISRIVDLEEDRLSKRCATYFDKIESASSRMRDLIDNLLALSKIDDKGYAFDSVDLNITLNEVLDIFSESLDTLNIEIEIDDLPTVNAIPFLMEQLFTNLIGNALKYKAKDRATKIIIESSKVHGRQISQDFIKTHAYYHVIKIMDNGIGFNAEDGGRIFQLFQRLHSKSEYSGTGLGLAICKKIVLKHHGHIYANSIKGKGSVFTIYLPSGKLKFPSKRLN